MAGQPVAATDLIGSEWTQNASIPYRAMWTRHNEETQVFEVGLVRLDMLDATGGAGRLYADPETIVHERDGWRPSNEAAAELVKGHAEVNNAVYVRFDGPPGHDAPRFVETEDAEGRGVGGFNWEEMGDGTWRLGPFARP